MNVIEREELQSSDAGMVARMKEQLQHLRASFALKYAAALVQLLCVGGLVSLFG